MTFPPVTAEFGRGALEQSGPKFSRRNESTGTGDDQIISRANYNRQLQSVCFRPFQNSAFFLPPQPFFDALLAAPPNASVPFAHLFISAVSSAGSSVVGSPPSHQKQLSPLLFACWRF